jgi:hypothetical protein
MCTSEFFPNVPQLLNFIENFFPVGNFIVDSFRLWDSLFSFSLQNVIDHLELAVLYQMRLLYHCCGQLIRRNLKTMMEDAKYMEPKEKSPKLVLFILEATPDECDNPEYVENCSNCGNYGYFARTCPKRYKSIEK